MNAPRFEAIPYAHRFGAATLLMAKANRLAEGPAAPDDARKLGAHRAALAYYDLALLLLKPFDPNYPTILNWKCLLQVKLGQFEDAVAGYREIVRLSDATDGKAPRNATAQLAEASIAQYGAMQNTPLPADSGDPTTFDEPPFCMHAEQFCTLLLEGKAKKAHQLLTPALQAKLPAKELARSWAALLGGVPAAQLTVTLQQHLVDWPARQADEIGWCYFAVTGGEISEAVSVVVARTPHNGYWVSQVEFGRP